MNGLSWAYFVESSVMKGSKIVNIRFGSIGLKSKKCNDRLEIIARENKEWLDTSSKFRITAAWRRVRPSMFALLINVGMLCSSCY